jgi:hypothetical protein
MTTESNNTFEEANENILDNEDETVYFNKQKFAEIIFNKIVYDVIEEDEFCDEHRYTDEDKRSKERFKSIFLPLISLNDSIQESLFYLGINECEKDYEHFLLTAIEQTLLITELENKIENISEKNDKFIEKLSSIESTINKYLYSIDRKINSLANISVSYEYKRLRIYLDYRQKRKVRDVGSWFNKTTESYYEDAYYLIIEENGTEVKKIETSNWERGEIDESGFLSVFNANYGINGWELFNSPETISGGYECLIKKQTKT